MTWKKQTKGNAKIYSHPDILDGRSIVENHLGVWFDGRLFPSVNAAKEAANIKIAMQLMDRATV